MIIAAPHDLNAAYCVSYGFYLWKTRDGQPEVWRHVTYRHATKTSEAINPHWVKIVSMDDITRHDARLEIKSAWKEYQDHCAAHGVRS